LQEVVFCPPVVCLCAAWQQTAKSEFWKTIRQGLIGGGESNDDQPLPLKRLRIGVEKYLVRKARHVILVSDTNKATATKYFSFDNDRVIQNWIDLRLFDHQQVSKHVRATLPIGKDTRVILFIARFIHQKQPLVLLGIAGKVTMEPFRSDVPEVLAAADIFVLPSLWEGLPIGLLEAMAMGKTVIGTRVDDDG
jgi:glycosyltransferase involved in cell wall biosynthesis